MKRAKLIRIYSEPWDKTLGVLQVQGITGALFTMEPGSDEEGGACVPDGTYLAQWIVSPTYGKTWTLIGEDVSAELEDGASRNQIRIHSGNRDEDSKGCLIPGLSIVWNAEAGEPMVAGSRDGLTRLKVWIGEQDFLLVIRSGTLPRKV